MAKIVSYDGTLPDLSTVKKLVDSNNEVFNEMNLVADVVEAMTQLAEKHDEEIKALHNRIADLERLLIVKGIERDYDVD